MQRRRAGLGWAGTALWPQLHKHLTAHHLTTPRAREKAREKERAKGNKLEEGEKKKKRRRNATSQDWLSYSP